MAVSLPVEALGHDRGGERALEQRDCEWGECMRAIVTKE